MDNLRRLQDALAVGQRKLVEAGYNFVIEASVLADGGLLVTVSNLYDPDIRFPLAWLLEYSQGEYDEMLDYITGAFNDRNIDLAKFSIERTQELARAFNSMRIIDPEKDAELKRFERERDEFLKQRQNHNHVV